MIDSPLRAVIFDVDGTLSETERHGHRAAFNLAFEEAGLPDRWGDTLYGELLQVTGGKPRLRHYFENRRGMPPEDAESLAVTLHRSKTDIFKKIIADRELPPRSGVIRLLDDLASKGMRLAVATTGDREWVDQLLERFTSEARAARFDVVITGDDVQKRKPNPEAYALTLAQLGCEPWQALAVEDSLNGLISARGAGLSCLAVVSEYNEAAQLLSADLVVDGFGDTDLPTRVLHNPHGIVMGPLVDARTVERLHRAALQAQKRAPFHAG